MRAFFSFGGVCMLLYVCASVCVLSTQSARGGIVQLKRRASNRSGTSRGVAPEKLSKLNGNFQAEFIAP